MTRRLREDPRYNEEEKMEAVVQASIWSQNHDPQLHAAIEDSLKTEQPAVYDNEAELQREYSLRGKGGGRARCCLFC